MHEDGTGAEKSNFKAVKFYQKACDLNDSNGCFNLGVMYKDGTGNNTMTCDIGTRCLCLKQYHDM
jgi:TPR repeat protein